MLLFSKRSASLLCMPEAYLHCERMLGEIQQFTYVPAPVCLRQTAFQNLVLVTESLFLTAASVQYEQDFKFHWTYHLCLPTVAYPTRLWQTSSFAKCLSQVLNPIIEKAASDRAATSSVVDAMLAARFCEFIDEASCNGPPATSR